MGCYCWLYTGVELNGSEWTTGYVVLFIKSNPVSGYYCGVVLILIKSNEGAVVYYYCG